MESKTILERIRSGKQKHFLGIEPGAPRSNVLSGFDIKRLGLAVCRNILQQNGWQVTIYYQDTTDKFFDNPLLHSPITVVGISTVTSTAPVAYEIARKIKQINPQILIVMGGFHPTACTDEALDVADFVVRGEGEETIRELFCSDVPLKEIQGLSYWRVGKKQHNPERALLASLSYKDTLIDEQLCRNPVTPVLFSRGCPYNCNFCAVSQVMGSRMRTRPPQEVVDELKFAAKHGAQRIFIVDDNFFGDIKQATELLRLLVREKIKLPTVIQMRADTRVSRNPEILRLMREAGIFMLCVGIESVEDESLKEVNKGVNLEQVIEFVTVMREWQFSFYAMFVFGSFQDDINTPAKILAFMRRYLPHELLQIMHLTPTPGTRFYEEIKPLIFDFNWADFDANRVIWQHPKMSARQRYEILLEAYKDWYGPLNVGRIFRQKLFNDQWEAIKIAPYFLKGVYRTIKEWEKFLAQPQSESFIYCPQMPAYQNIPPDKSDIADVTPRRSSPSAPRGK